MSIVKVDVEETTIDHGLEIKCQRCGRSVEVQGRSERSIMRGCIMLREQCPRAESNYYKFDGIDFWVE